MSSARNDASAIAHFVARDHQEHAAAFAAASEEARRRHLAVAHGIRPCTSLGDVSLEDTIRREISTLLRDEPERFADRLPTLVDVHEWWTTRQRRTLTYGGRGPTNE